jgi:hypothetical protein
MRIQAEHRFERRPSATDVPRAAGIMKKEKKKAIIMAKPPSASRWVCPRGAGDLCLCASLNFSPLDHFDFPANERTCCRLSVGVEGGS